MTGRKSFDWLFSSAWENIFIPGLGGFSIGSLAGENFFFFFFMPEGAASVGFMFCVRDT